KTASWKYGTDWSKTTYQKLHFSVSSPKNAGQTGVQNHTGKRWFVVMCAYPLLKPDNHSGLNCN
ncbi:hypothetical protein, partial [Sulfitobacter mediterraneus]|uniref:hypothetical protein n=1 Tax=Sulfitobacter mediterraneus TaxID=83219 RepID=UPI001E6567F8